MAKRVLYSLIAIGVILLVSLTGLNAQQSSGEAISIGGDDIGGVVTSTKGPEAGVWNCLAFARPHPLPPAPLTIAMQSGIIAG